MTNLQATSGGLFVVQFLIDFFYCFEGGGMNKCDGNCVVLMVIFKGEII